MSELLILTSKKMDSSSIWFLYGLAQNYDIIFIKIPKINQRRAEKTSFFLKLDRKLCHIFNQLVFIYFITFKKGFFKTFTKLKNSPVHETLPMHLPISSKGIILTDEIIDTNLYPFDVYNLHHGEINDYKGRDCMYWEAYFEASYTPTVHQVSDQIDRGPIMYQVRGRYSKMLELDRIYKDVECGKMFPNVIDKKRKTLPFTFPSKSVLFKHSSLRIRIIGRLRYVFGR